MTSRMFPGFVVFDFGTTNSSAVLVDLQNEIPPGMPEEQLDRFKTTLQEELISPNGERSLFSSPLAEEWQQLKREVHQAVTADFPGKTIDQVVLDDVGAFRVLRELELKLKGHPEIEQIVLPKICSVLRAALRQPRLRSADLLPIPLDLERYFQEQPDSTEHDIPSELEILESIDGEVSAEATNGKKRLQANMGWSAREERRKNPSPSSDRFHPSPKRELGNQRTFFLDEKKSQSYQSFDVVTAAFDQLVEKLDHARLNVSDDKRQLGS